VMVAYGEPKARAVRLIAEADGYRPEWPATIVAECSRPLLFVDRAAASELIKSPDRQAAPLPNRN